MLGVSLAWLVGAAFALPACALLGSLLLRGEVTLVFAVGFPFLDLRYVTPSLPLLAAFVAVWACGFTLNGKAVRVTAKDKIVLP